MRTKEQIAEYQREYRLKNLDKLKTYKLEYDNKNRDALISKARDKRHSVYYVYSHINNNDDLYIGSGTKRRPYQFSGRRSNWRKCFSEDTVRVAILKECKTKEEALRIERVLISSIGVKNLVNVNSF